MGEQLEHLAELGRKPGDIDPELLPQWEQVPVDPLFDFLLWSRDGTGVRGWQDLLHLR